MTRSSTTRRKTQGGYALLMIFLMAAIVALMLYQQLPRVAFESEREKEQLLIDRGEQYTRAIQLYYLANNRQYPTSIDDLEKREKRFLRQRFKDPFTGKAEWRIVHTNGAFLTDSLVTKPPTAADPNSSTATASTTTTFNPSPDGQPQQPQVNAAVLARPSDRQFTPPGGFPGQDSSGQPVNTQFPIGVQGQPGQGGLPPITLQPGAANQPGGLPPITLTPSGPGGVQTPGQVPGQLPGQIPGQIPGQATGPGRGVIAPFPGAPGAAGFPGGIQPNVPPGFQIDANGQLVPIAPVPGQNPGQGVPGLPFSQAGQPGFPNPGQPGGFQPGAPGTPNAAASTILQGLQTPRQNQTTPVTTGGNQVGAIAGVASTYKGPSIKVYKDQGAYEKWEFVFDPNANRPVAPGAPPNGQGNGARNNQTGNTSPFGLTPTR